MIRQNYDLQADALYITLMDRPVARTAEIDPATLVDLDAEGRAVGIEIISPARDWPVMEIITEYRITGADRDQLLGYFGPAHLAGRLAPGAPVAPAAPHPGGSVPVRIPEPA